MAALREHLEAATGERIAALEALEPERAKGQEAGLEAGRSVSANPCPATGTALPGRNRNWGGAGGAPIAILGYRGAEDGERRHDTQARPLDRAGARA